MHRSKTHAFDRHRFAATLDDDPSARDLLSMLPLALTVEDYADNEKIARLPRKLTEDGSGPFGNEAPGDLCTYAPWGNLAFFYAGHRYSHGPVANGDSSCTLRLRHSPILRSSSLFCFSREIE
jgi:hypothetical protein